MVFSETPVFRAEWLFSAIEQSAEINENYYKSDSLEELGSSACNDPMAVDCENESYSELKIEFQASIEQETPENKPLSAENEVDTLHEARNKIIEECNQSIEINKITDDGFIAQDCSDSDISDTEEGDEDLFSAECVVVNNSQKRSGRRWLFNTPEHLDDKPEITHSDMNDDKETTETAIKQTEQAHKNPEKVRGMAAFIRRK
ncbi:hypothetical protein D3C84_813810 [compost metagenome]